MADIHDRSAVKFEEIHLVVDNDITGIRVSKSDTMIKKTPSTSRFQVDRVDFKDELKVNGHDKETNVAPVVTPSGIDTDAEVPNVERQQSQDDDKHSYDSPTFVAGSTSPTDTLNNHTFTNDYNDTHFKTFGRNTTEALPHVDHYRNLLSATAALKSRPTLAELHEEKEEGEFRAKQREPLLASEEKLVEEGIKPKEKSLKFGWIKGVLIRCLLNIWGVMLFLRLSWVVGQAGIGFTTLIILLSAVVTTITSLSMAAICTNGEVKGGGAYFMISRSLGPEFGGAIGLIFSVANAVAVAMYVVGFAETVRDLLVGQFADLELWFSVFFLVGYISRGEILKAHNALMVDEVNDIRIIGALTISLLLCIAIVGMEWEARAQIVLLVALLMAVVNFLIGTFIPPTEEKFSKGIVGYKGEVFAENFGSSYTEGENFFSVFAVFFPAATGILAGANISGDLKNAQKDIPKGTFIAILLSSIVYIGVAWVLGACILRGASGYIVPVIGAAAGMYNNTGLNMTELQNLTVVLPAVNSSQPSLVTDSAINLAKNCTLGKDGRCNFGLLYDFQTMKLASGFGPLVTIGIFSATLSSALASLVSAPKVFQAVCKDRIFPLVHVFSNGYGPSDNPRRAYILAYFIGLAFICIGDLNAIAPIISNFFLMSYALINYSCFDASLARSPGWRPAFKYYSMWLSLVGALLCISVMFIINWWTALITFGVIASLFVYVHYSKPDVNWGSSTQAHVYRSALQSTLKLLAVEDHIKNFRPQMLVLTGLPNTRPALVDFVYTLTRKISLMVCGNVVIGSQSDCLKELNQRNTGPVYQWLKNRKVKSFYNVTTAQSFRAGVQSLMQNVGVGKLRPNIMMMGFMSDWRTRKTPSEVEDYFNIIHDAFDLQYGVGILRVKEAFYTEAEQEVMAISDPVTHSTSKLDESYPSTPTMLRRGSAMSKQSSDHSSPQGDETEASTPDAGLEDRVMTPSMEKLCNRFNKKQKKGTIDVWWLFDDGGLTLLIPYLLTTKSFWSGCRLRIFFAGTKRGEIDREQRQMATLLSKFRIDCKDMIVLPNIGKPPKEESMNKFDKLLEGWMMDEEKGETQEKYPWKVSEDEKEILKDKTKRNIRLKELLDEHSQDASLVVMTLPMPRKGTCPAGLYMAWLETLTQDMPPILLLRGNQTSVLTFYS